MRNIFQEIIIGNINFKYIYRYPTINKDFKALRTTADSFQRVKQITIVENIVEKALTIVQTIADYK